MYEFGSPANWDASPGEHNLIDLAKCPTQKTQKRNETFTMQVTHCLQESSILSKPWTYFKWDYQEIFLKMKFLHNGTQHELISGVVGRPFACVMTENGQISFVFQNKFSKHNVIHPILEKWFQEQKSDPLSIIYDSACIELFHEYKCNGILYWAHPDYFSMGAWYNWTMVTFESDDSDISVHDDVDEVIDKYFNDNEYPSKIFCFFWVMEDPKTHAVVHSCCNRDTDQDSILFQRWNKEMLWKANQCYEPVLHAVSVESFGEHILVIDPVVREYVEIKEIEPVYYPMLNIGRNNFYLSNNEHIRYTCKCIIFRLI